MYAPLPPGLLVVVRPPPAWVRMGLVGKDTLWALEKAVYGLRVSPRAWGVERDSKFREVQWTSGSHTFRLRQCHNDSQV